IADERLFDAHIYKPENVIERITSVRNNARIRKSFNLEETTTVKIYALGEGLYGSMHDFAWIERGDDKRLIWEMNYRNTTEAGGAVMNRVYTGSIMLSPGKYFLYYSSNQDHSYQDWIASPPGDPEAYGITLFRVLQ
ncbi:hypothetical protein ACFL67_02190, partial [candidate division KSB1 bacterium]